MGSASRGKVMLISGGYDHSIRFWDVASGTMVKQIPVFPFPPSRPPVPGQYCDNVPYVYK